MKIHLASPLRTAYWKARSWGLDLQPWHALATEIPTDVRLVIVGNAGYLRDVDWGEWIDGHDLVMRMNNFELEGHARAVGRRVDLLLTNFSRYTISFANPEFRRPRWVISSRPVNFLKYPQWGIHDRLGEHITAGMMALNRRRVFVPNLACFVEQTASLGAYPTTGLMALRFVLDVLAHHRCHVLFVGFSFFQGRSHYFCDQTVDVARLHKPQFEREEFRDVLRHHADWMRVDPIMRGYLNPEGGTDAEEVQLADSSRSA